jgi:hypothetical protein
MIIQLIEINDDERLSVHYDFDKPEKPRFIQYWNYKTETKPVIYYLKKANHNKKTRKNYFAKNNTTIL